MIRRVVIVVQFCLVILFAGIGVYCFWNYSELYPFAPYGMYGQKHEIQGTSFFQFYCLTSEGKEKLTNAMSQPLDEARLTQSFEESYFSGSDDDVHEKLESLKIQTKQNKFNCRKIILNVVNFSSPEDFLKNNPRIKKSFETSESL